MIELSEAARTTAGVVLLTVVAVESGGAFMVRVATGAVPTTDFQRRFFRAGHAHAGMLVTLGLVCLLLAEAAGLTGVVGWFARTGVLLAAILMPAGFFLSAVGAGRERPGRWIVLLGLGAVVLAGAVVTLGLGLILSP